MIDLYLPEQVQAMDQRAFARGVDPAGLMDRAAAHLARGICTLARDRGMPLHGLRVTLVCGKGNNGGDGLAAARHLQRRGVAAITVLLDDLADLGPDAARELAAWQARGGRVESLVATDDPGVPDLEDAVRAHVRSRLSALLSRADVAVDCILGTGTSGAPRGRYGPAVEALVAFHEAGGAVVSCDLPTGVDAGTGRVPGEAVHADLTVTLGAHKQGLWLPPAAELAGRLVLGEIGVDDGEADPVARVLEPADLPVLAPPPTPRSHKRSRGVVVVYAGSERMLGAAVLAARAAVTAGAGLVTLATPSAVVHRLGSAVPEVMRLPLPDDADGIVEAVTAICEGADVLAMGPGLGLAEATQQAVRRLVTDPPAHVVLDADGINAFRDHTDLLVPAGGARDEDRCLVLTPQAKELGRLAGTSGHGTHARRTEIALEQAGRMHATIVAKGPRSVVAGPDGSVWITPTGGPGLATGGTGDVLTGVTAALLAQRPVPESVAAAAYLHGLAGDLAGRARSARGTSAGDVIDHLPAAALQLGI